MISKEKKIRINIKVKFTMVSMNIFLSIATIITYSNLESSSLASQDHQWISHGPYGGEVLSVAVDPVSSDRVYAGTAYGGVFKSIEGGLKGVPITLGQIEYVTSVAIDPLEPWNVYAGNWQELYKSSDYGETWVKINDKVGNSIIINPLDPDVIYVAGSNDVVYKTINGGQSWEAATDSIGLFGLIRDMAMDPTGPDVVYVLIEGGPIFKTIDAGSTWSDAIYIPQLYWPKTIDFNHTGTLYVGGCVGMAEGLIVKSTDGGVSWVTIYSSQIVNSSIESICIDPSDSDILFAGTGREILRSSDTGWTWEEVYVNSEDLEYTNDVNSLCIDPLNPSTVYAGLHTGGLLKSEDGGFTWSKVEMGYPMITALTKDPQDETILYAGSEREGLFRSLDGGETWLETELKRGWISSIEIDPLRTNIIYVTGHGVQKSIDHGHSWTEIDSGLSLAWEAPYSIAINPDSTHVLYLGTGGTEGGALYKSTNGGESWDELLPGSVTWITIDSTNTAIIYAYIQPHTFTPGLAKTYDSGLNWGCILPKLITSLTIDPANSNILYAGATSNNIFKSVTAGSTWFSINEGLPSFTGYILAICTDPSNSNFLFAQTVRQGVFKSTNGGATWNEMDPQLPFKQGDYSYQLDHTMLLVREGNYLLHAGTQAGVWSLTLPPGAKGDVNRDDNVDVLDVLRVVHIILKLPLSPTEYELWASDFNSDGEVNILDVVGIVNKILNPAFSSNHILGEK